MTDPTTDETGTERPRRRRLRVFFLIVGAGLAAVIVDLLHPPLLAWFRDTTESKYDPNTDLVARTVDDESRMNATRVKEVWPIPSDRAEAEEQLAVLVRRAAEEGTRIAIGGARHSMGGHTIYPDGIVIDMLPFDHMEIDEEAEILHVGSGARWSEIIPYLDARGRSVWVMQSNNSFSVGGSISVNCHGWQHNRPPIASTVESFRLLTADGTIVRCSRQENEDLFGLVLGGYGLFGVILEVDLRVVRNQRYRVQRQRIPPEDYVRAYREASSQADVGMVYARLSIVPSSFLSEAILSVFLKDPDPSLPIPALTEPGLAAIRRQVFRGSAGSDHGKKLRWEAEKRLSERLGQEAFSRNQLLNEGVETFRNTSEKTTDILHEYFIPYDQFAEFLARLRRIIPHHGLDLLNVTVRTIHEDEDTVLRYADTEMFAFVMLFNQARSEEGERIMEAGTRDIIESALELGGRYYLPYRLHGTVEQFQRAYPRAREFFEAKRKHDPGEIFQNGFYLKYGASGS